MEEERTTLRNTFERDKISEEESNEVGRIRDAIARRRTAEREEIFDEVVGVLEAGAMRKTAEREKVEETLTELTASPIEQPRPYGTAGRTLPAQFADARYRSLPEWQRAFRTPQVDRMCQQFFQAVAAKDHVALQRIHDEDRQWQREMAIGEMAAVIGGAFDGTVGQAVPLAVANYINEILYRFARFRALARTFTGSNIRIPLQSTVSSSTWEGESDLIAAGDPSTVDALVMQLRKLASIGVISNEALSDGDAFGLVAWMVNDVVQQMAETEDAALYSTGVGSGSDQPDGFELNDISVGTAPTYFVPTLTQVADFALVTVIDYLHVVKMFFALPEGERRQAIWTGPDTVMETLSTIVDGNGRPIFRMANDAGGIVSDSVAGGVTGTVLGRPVHNLPGKEGAGQDSNRLYLMSPARTYAVLESAAVAVTSDTSLGFLDDTTHFRFVRRVNGGVIGNNVAARPNYVYTGNISGPGTPA